jgi:flagellar biosynthesis/type III secretory pathway M-ring protein FliF/YscJ
MVVLLHGAAGGWDELAIAVAAFAVLWIAVKLAGRKPAAEDDEDLEAKAEAETAAEAEAEAEASAGKPHLTPKPERPSPSKLG